LTENKDFRCKLCFQKYESQEEADRCVTKNGQPKPKFSLKDRIIMIDQYKPEIERVGTIEKVNFSRPNSIHEPHSVIYWILVEAENGKLIDQTKPMHMTAQEKELEPISIPIK